MVLLIRLCWVVLSLLSTIISLARIITCFHIFDNIGNLTSILFSAKVSDYLVLSQNWLRTREAYWQMHHDFYWLNANRYYQSNVGRHETVLLAQTHIATPMCVLHRNMLACLRGVTRMHLANQLYWQCEASGAPTLVANERQYSTHNGDMYAYFLSMIISISLTPIAIKCRRNKVVLLRQTHTGTLMNHLTSTCKYCSIHTTSGQSVILSLWAQYCTNTGCQWETDIILVFYTQRRHVYIFWTRF